MSTDSLTRYQKLTAGHEMTVLHDAGPYRHLRFNGPNHFHWFDVVTWPMNLTISGGMGSYSFRNDEEDILALFLRSSSPQYWCEKVRAVDAATPAYGWLQDSFEEEVAAAVEKWAAELDPDDAFWLRQKVQEEVTAYSASRGASMQALVNFRFEGRSFTGWDDWKLEGLTDRFRYNCHAVSDAAEKYAAWKKNHTAAPTERTDR